MNLPYCSEQLARSSCSFKWITYLNGWDRSKNHPKMMQCFQKLFFLYNEGVASEKSWYPEMPLVTHPIIINNYPFQDWFPIFLPSRSIGHKLASPLFKAPTCGAGVCRPCCWFPAFGASPRFEAVHRRLRRGQPRGGRRHGGRRAMTTRPSPGP